MRRTKIVATLGPATDDDSILEQILDAGVSVVRINFSHCNTAKHLNRIAKVRHYSKKKGVYIAILMDLQGPKVRIGSFVDDRVLLKEGDKFILDTNCDLEKGDNTRVGVNYKFLPRDVKKGSVLLLDDGKIILSVCSVVVNEVICNVTQAGYLASKKGINVLGGGLSIKTLTTKDKIDIKTVAKANADYVALSFPSSANDIKKAKKLLKEAGSDALLIAKIERAETLKNNVIEDIIANSDGIMVARGDLGVEIGDSKLPAQQKRLISLARQNNKVVITATQMLDSMINSPVPTRAEVFDVANAVLDGTDAVMLSAETAVGNFPVNTVKVMHNVCIEAEKNPIAKKSNHRVNTNFKHIDETIAMSAMYAGNHLAVKVIATLSQTGKTALLMSRISSNTPIFVMSNKNKTLQRVTLYRGVYPCYLSKSNNWAKINNAVVKKLKDNKIVKKNNIIIITKGMYQEGSGGTNLMKNCSHLS